jgi:hypothetical protein
MDTIHITIRERADGYTAQGHSGDHGDEEACGKSPDEALGYAIRQLWLAGELDQYPAPHLDIRILDREAVAEEEAKTRKDKQFIKFLKNLL